MSKLNGKTVGAFAGAAMLAVTGAASVVPAVAQPVAVDAPEAAVAADQAAGKQVAAAPVVSGDFAFAQDVITPNDTIGTVFAKAAATLCQCTAQEAATCCASAIAVGGDVTGAFSATVADMAAGDASTRVIMGCSCATNVAGGGAIANAEAEGVTLESVYARAQAAQK